MKTYGYYTLHGAERAKERMGLSEKKAIRRLVLARERGVREADCKWSADRRFLGKSSDDIVEAVAYNGFCYILDKASGICITTYRLPRDFGQKKTRYNPRKTGSTYQYEKNENTLLWC